jgi:hypothetical protein
LSNLIPKNGPLSLEKTKYLLAAGGLVVVDVDALKLEVGIAMVGSGGVNTVFVGDDFPELGSDLVTALTGLEMDNLSHLCVLLKT